MLVKGTFSIFRLVLSYWRLIPIVLIIVFLVEALNDYALFDRATFSYAVIGLVASSISIFLAFRVNESYARWWEARQCWGNIVAGSRTFARKVVTLIDSANDGGTEPEVLKLREQLVHRQIAFANALRLSLREQENWDELRPFLSEDDFKSILAVSNKPGWLLQRQLEELVKARGKGWTNDSAISQFDRTQRAVEIAFAGCERIKGTPIPVNVTGTTRLIAWGMAIILPMVILDSENKFDLIDMAVVPALMLFFLLIERLGRELQYPFENDIHGTPMTALCRGIERDLRQILGEESLPAEIEPENGVLM